MGSTGSEVEVTLRRLELMVGGGEGCNLSLLPVGVFQPQLVFIDVKAQDIH